MEFWYHFGQMKQAGLSRQGRGALWVIPTKVGIQLFVFWIPAYAGMTPAGFPLAQEGHGGCRNDTGPCPARGQADACLPGLAPTVGGAKNRIEYHRWWSSFWGDPVKIGEWANLELVSFANRRDAKFPGFWPGRCPLEAMLKWVLGGGLGRCQTLPIYQSVRFMGVLAVWGPPVGSTSG